MIEERRYRVLESATFLKVRERFGGLSNMASGFGFEILGRHVPSSEHWYQIGRFPHRPDIQEEILGIGTPILAKRKAYAHLDQSRPDFQSINVALMKHALRLKILSHRPRMLELYAATRDMPIVEISFRDPFWGARPDGEGHLLGKNVLGRLHMGERERLRHRPDHCLDHVPDPHIPDLCFLGEAVGALAPGNPDQGCLSL